MGRGGREERAVPVRALPVRGGRGRHPRGRRLRSGGDRTAANFERDRGGRDDPLPRGPLHVPVPPAGHAGRILGRGRPGPRIARDAAGVVRRPRERVGGLLPEPVRGEIPLRPEEGRAKDHGRGGTALRRYARGRRRRPRPHARAPVPAFPRRPDPVPRGLRPDGVRPVVRRHPVRHRRVPEVRPPPRLDRRGPVRGLPRGAGPPRPDRREDERVPRGDRPAGGGAAGLCTGAAHPRRRSSRGA